MDSVKQGLTVKKAKAVLFKSENKKIDMPAVLTLNNEQIEFVHFNKSLGVSFSEDSS